MKEKFQKFLFLHKELTGLKSVHALLQWDTGSLMPMKGIQDRGWELGYIQKLRHEKLLHPDFSKLVDELLPWAQNQGPDSFECRLLKISERDLNWASKIPSTFVGELSQHQGLCYEAWIRAKTNNSFGTIRPLLEKTLELSRKLADFYGYSDHPADPLIEVGEPGMNVARLRPLFKKLGAGIRDLQKKVVSNNASVKFPDKEFSRNDQLLFSRKVVEKMGYDFKRGRLDESPHPFMARINSGDIRITTRVFEKELEQCLFGCIHECGHALYEMGVHEKLEGTLLAEGASTGLHESQSRLWENIVGRSWEFWQHYYPDFQKTFPEQLSQFPLEQFYKAVNRVRPSLIRTEADEVTYNLHVFIRFELECELLEGSLEIKNLPEAWNAKYEHYLGVRPSTDSQGCLQDIHWYSGNIGGYFQGYTLGNMYAAQFFESFLEKNPKFFESVERGDFQPLLSWLKENLHQHGRVFDPDEILKKITGKELSEEPLLRYLEKKYFDPRLAG